MKRAFTLIELLMVIAIIGIITTLAVNKVGGVREASARKVSLANQVAVERAVESFLTSGGRLDRLDSLVSIQNGDLTKAWRHSGRESGGGGFDCTYTNFTAQAGELYQGPTRDVVGESAETYRADYNAGVTRDLAAVLCPYELKPAQVDALVNRLGLRFVLFHNDVAGDPASVYANQKAGDGAYLEELGDSGKNPNESGVAAIAVTNGMALFAINPIVERGRAIYRACGQNLARTERAGGAYDEAESSALVSSTGGPILVFGLGGKSSCVGRANAGIESAPMATYLPRNAYARYILLIRLRTAGSVVVPEFAGVIDPSGNTLRDAREIVRNL